MKDFKDVINPRPMCRAGLHLMTPENVSIKPSTRQRYCIACRDAKKQRRKGLFAIGEIWTKEQLELASLPLLTMQQEKLVQEIEKMQQRLYSMQIQLKQVNDARQPKVDALAGNTWD